MRDLKLDRLRILSAGKETPLVLHNVKGAEIIASKGPEGVPKWISRRGSTADVTVR